MSKPRQLVIALPIDLFTELDQLAEEEDRTTEQQATNILRQALKVRQAANAKKLKAVEEKAHVCPPCQRSHLADTWRSSGSINGIKDLIAMNGDRTD